MTSTLFASELMLMTIAAIAFIVFWDLLRTQDGMLRIIMMSYMVAEWIVYFGSAIYFWLLSKGYTHMSIDTFRLLILPTKAAVMIALLIWIRKNDGL